MDLELISLTLVKTLSQSYQQEYRLVIRGICKEWQEFKSDLKDKNVIQITCTPPDIDNDSVLWICFFP